MIGKFDRILTPDQKAVKETAAADRVDIFLRERHRRLIIRHA